MMKCKDGIEREYYQMTLIDHHQEYPLPTHPNVDEHIIWDGYKFNNVSHDVMKLRDLPKLTDDELITLLKYRCFGPYHPEALPIDPIDDTMIHSTLIRITGSLEHLNEWAKIYAQSIINECVSVGGDDSYYDYFPTYVSMFFDVCVNLKLRDLFESTIKTVMSLEPYCHDKDDEIDEETLSYNMKLFDKPLKIEIQKTFDKMEADAKRMGWK